MKKKSHRPFYMLLILVLLLAACSGNSESGETENSGGEMTEEDKQGRHIDLWPWS